MEPIELLAYLKELGPAGVEALAERVGTTVAHLRNVAYKQRIASAALARQIQDASEGRVPVSVLRPKDWHLIWGRELHQMVDGGAIVTGAPSPALRAAQEPSHVG